MGIWEENRSRLQPPWNGRTVARRNGVWRVAIPETRQAMIERRRPVRHAVLSIDPCRRFISVEYCAIVQRAVRIPESLDWPA
jgi:hypothetical protein